ncbi:MAG: RsmD family RNA methyltransferase [Candidatus Buchananbacteria bacterium]|nr:RsmD family RNA methyltransferase [Candidatus Buchananbacteria bacterium]
MNYIFIYGNHPELSRAEVQSLLPTAKLERLSEAIDLVSSLIHNPERLIERLGGTIKIAEVIGSRVDERQLAELLAKGHRSGKLIFGLSFYTKASNRLGMEIKRHLKEQGIGSRLVTSKEPILSSVIVRENKCQEIIVTPKHVALTRAVQNYKADAFREFKRPASDSRSGMLPTKLARMLVNLAQAPRESVILDPFCGSGTVLTEALALGYRQLIGSDNSQKAVTDTKINLNWLSEHLRCSPEVTLHQQSVDGLSKVVAPQSVTAIVTEPYLGPPLHGNEPEARVIKIISDLRPLYQAALQEFLKVLVAGGRVVMVIPEWHVGNQIYYLGVEQFPEFKKFKRHDDNHLLYHREGQHVWRKIIILEKA